MAKKEKFKSKIQEYMLAVAEPRTKALCEITVKMTDASARQSLALRKYLRAVQEKKVDGMVAVELYIANDAAMKAFEECEKMAIEALEAMK